MKRYTLNIKRIMINICIILMMIILINIVSNYTFGNKHIETKNITVTSNDTLWQIAEDVCNESSEELNVQNIVIEIKNINNLKSSNIYSGQVLEIPIYN